MFGWGNFRDTSKLCNYQSMWLLVELNAISLYHYCYYKSLQPMKTINIPEWEFYIWTLKFWYRFFKISKFVIVPFETWLWAVFIFKKKKQGIKFVKPLKSLLTEFENDDNNAKKVFNAYSFIWIFPYFRVSTKFSLKNPMIPMTLPGTFDTISKD